MMFVNDPVCERCWFRAINRPPMRTRRPPSPETCHACGWPTVAGIYVRRDADGPAAPEPDRWLEPGDLVWVQAGDRRVYVVLEDGALERADTGQALMDGMVDVVDDL